MRAWLLGIVLVATIAWTLWVRARVRHRVFALLIGASKGDPARAGRITHLLQGGAAVLAIAAIAAAIYVETAFHAVWLRALLTLSVLALYGPLAATLGRTSVRRIRKPVRVRLIEQGASEPVAASIARAGAPWAIVGSVVTLSALLILLWHHLRA